MPAATIGSVTPRPVPYNSSVSPACAGFWSSTGIAVPAWNAAAKAGGKSGLGRKRDQAGIKPQEQIRGRRRYRNLLRWCSGPVSERHQEIAALHRCFLREQRVDLPGGHAQHRNLRPVHPHGCAGQFVRQRKFSGVRNRVARKVDAVYRKNASRRRLEGTLPPHSQRLPD